MKNLVAKDLMSTEIITVKQDMSIHELAACFSENMISGAPVVDNNGRLSGVVTLSDIVRNDERRSKIVRDKHESDYYIHGWENNYDGDDLKELHLEDDDDLSVKDIMTPLIFKVPETESISVMAGIMVSGRIHRLFVTRDDQVVGIVTTLDLLKAIRDLD